MLGRVNPFGIALDHAATFRNFDDRKVAVSDALVHVLAPVGVSLGVYHFGVTFSENGVSLLVTSLSVFVGLLFNLLVLATSLKIADHRSVIFASSRQLSREVLVHTEFAICVAFFAILFLLPAAGDMEVPAEHVETVKQVWRLASAVVAGLLVLFLLTLLMILKRMHTVLLQHFRESGRDPQAGQDGQPQGGAAAQ